MELFPQLFPLLGRSCHTRRRRAVCTWKWSKRSISFSIV